MNRFCAWCGNPLPEDGRSDQLYCSGKSTCRVRAFRARKAEKTWGAIQDNEEKKIFYQR